MPSQEQEQQDAEEDVPKIGSEGERRAGQREGSRQKKKLKWSPVARHHVVAALLSRSRAARASPAAHRTSPAAKRTSPAAHRTSPAATRTSPAAIRTPTFIDNDYGPYSEHVDAYMHEDDVEGDEQNVEDDIESDEQNVEDDEYNFEDEQQDVEDDEFVTASVSIRGLTSKFRSEAWKEYVPLIVNGQVSKGRCKHCEKAISAKRGQGTSALLKHLDRCKKRDAALRIVHGLNSTLRSPDGRQLNLAIPVIIDPRFKLEYVEFRLKQAFVTDPQVRINKVKKLFKSLFDEYFSKLNNGNTTVSQQTSHGHGQPDTTDDDMFGDWDNHLNEQRQGQVMELDRYLNESPISRSGEFDILKWWSANASTYPTLAAIARDVLAVPASTVASESAFSMGGRTVNDFRSRLNEESVEALVCSQDWYRGSASDSCLSAITDLVDLQDAEVDSPLEATPHDK